jgi:hypothetical protein
MITRSKAGDMKRTTFAAVALFSMFSTGAVCSGPVFGSEYAQAQERRPEPYKAGFAVQQFFDADSTKVFWMGDPDPFCCPCPEGTSPVTKAMSFFCGLPGRIEIGILDCRSNAVLHKYEFPRDSRSEYQFWACYSETSPKDTPTKLKYKFLSGKMDSDSEGPFKFVLMLNGNKKAVWPFQIPYRKDWTLILILRDSGTVSR